MNVAENRERSHARLFDLRPQAFGNAPGNILVKSAARNVGHALYRHFLKQREHGLDIDFGGRQQGLTKALSAELRNGRPEIRALYVEHLSHQGKAVGMHARRGQRNHDVPLPDALVVQNLILIDDSHGEPGEVVFVFGVKTGHFRRFSTDQRGAGLNAAFRDALDDIRDLFGIIFADRDVIEEKQGFRAAADHVVDAHRHAVDPHRIVLVHQKSEL